MANITKMVISFILLVSTLQAYARKIDIDDWDVQMDRAQEGEKEGDDNADLQFDLEITNEENRPPQNRKLPIPAKVQRQFNEEKDKLLAEAQAAGDNMFQNSTVFEVKGGFQYYDLFDWRKRQLKCCPAIWKYQCKSSWVNMPCFYNYNNQHGSWEWCCSFWPKVLIKKCDCCKCAVLTSYCAMEGTCNRRYSRRSFFAVCYRNGQWAYLKYMVKYLPSSCYCKI